MTGVDSSLRAQIRAAIQADYGESTILPANRMPRPRRLPTGSPALDYVTGGGVPFRQMTRMWGYYSTGKTTALLKMFAAAQNFGRLRHAQLMGLSALSLAAGESTNAKYLKDLAKREKELGSLSCLYVCPEAPDTGLAAALGLDLSKLELVPRTEIEIIGDIVQRSLAGVHVVGIDSTTATMSLDELAGTKKNDPTNALPDGEGIFKTFPMLRATKWGVNMDWWRARMSHDNCVIFTSHARAKLGGRASLQAQAAEHAPGGFALNHEPAVILHFMKGKSLKRKSNGGLEEIGDDARGSATASAFGKFQPAGGELVVRCEKNKVGVAGRTVLLHHDKRTGDFDTLHEYEKFASYFRVLEKSGSWWKLPDGTKTQQLRSTLESQAALRQRIESVTLRCAEEPDWEARRLAGQTESLVEIPSADAV